MSSGVHSMLLPQHECCRLADILAKTIYVYRLGHPGNSFFLYKNNIVFSFKYSKEKTFL